MDFIRVWNSLNVDEISKHLVIVDDIQGFCNSCKKTGIKYSQIDRCPECKTEFKYVTARVSATTQQGKNVLQKIINNLPDLTIIDYDDFKHALDKKKAHSLFSD